MVTEWNYEQNSRSLSIFLQRQLFRCLHNYFVAQLWFYFILCSNLKVNLSAAQSRTKLHAHFDCLRQCVIEALDERLATLMRVVDDAECSAVEPLDSCELILKERVNEAICIMEKGYTQCTDYEL